MKNNNRRMRQFFANKMHRQLFSLIFFAAVIPTLITTVALFYLIFNITADQFGIPEAIAANLFPAADRVIAVLSVSMPIVILAILVLAYKITHKIVGPFDRIIRELGEIIEGTKQDAIVLRGKDRFSPLVDKINQLAEKARSN